MSSGRDSARLFKFLVGSWTDSGPDSVALMIAEEDRSEVDRLLILLVGREAEAA